MPGVIGRPSPKLGISFTHQSTPITVTIPIGVGKRARESCEASRAFCACLARDRRVRFAQAVPTLHLHAHYMSYIDAISEVPAAFLSDPHEFELHDQVLARRSASGAGVIAWVTARLAYADAHYLAPEFPELGEGHRFFFQDILDGECFRKAWGYLDEGRPDPREAPLRRGRYGDMPGS